MKKATSNGTLTNPGKLYSFLDAATKSVTTDKDFTVDEMKKVAGSVQGMSAGKVQFVTVPWGRTPRTPTGSPGGSRTPTTCSPRSATTTRSRHRPRPRR